MQIPNNQSGLASTSLAERHLPLDNYKNNILKAKSQDENKKVGGQAMLSFPAVLPTSSSAVASIDDKSRYDCLYFSLSYPERQWIILQYVNTGKYCFILQILILALFTEVLLISILMLSIQNLILIYWYFQYFTLSVFKVLKH